ncbi:MAG: carbon dioxide concentrating mechanism protein [Spirulinaceae cyanobacterium SM2_1_0]|nr:carbon dioxide concentrating mechanism protein [Spirulinaceae cyanobacterium SM2_1_0]
MTLQPLQPTHRPDVRVSGDTIIDPSAAIAPGAILCAAPNSRIIVGAGACIGMGVILNAYAGTIELGVGASLGPGVLIVGKSQIGANACVGGASTIFNADVAALQVLPAGSLLGDVSRQVEVLAAPEAAAIADPWELPEQTAPVETLAATVNKPPPVVEQRITKAPGVPIFGKVYVNQLLMTLFPQGQTLNQREEPPA